MSKVEKSVFISYRRANIYQARAVYQDLRANDYDVFMDYENADSGAFEQIILSQIKARAHFVVILTPIALQRCINPEDWLRREIETAIDQTRNIVPVMMGGFNWDNMRHHLVGRMAVLHHYNGVTVSDEYFYASMEKLRRFLNIPIDAVLHPTPRATDYFISANRYYAEGEYDEAIPEYTESLRLDPHNPTAYYRRGIAYEQTGQTDSAQADFDRAITEASALIRQNSQDSEAYRARGVAYRKKNAYDRAIEDLTKAIRFDPQSALAYNNRGMVYLNGKKDDDSAIEDFSEAIRLNPQYTDAYANRGLAYEMKRDYDRAIADYDRVLAINPNDELAKQSRDEALRRKRGWRFWRG
jgi:Flp pilus assembly protein TadD